jgi:hypothetical protein
VVEGVTAIAVSVFAAAGTVSVALPLMPLSVAVTLVEPPAIAVPKPAAFTVATVASAVFQVAVFVTSAVVLSTYFAVAVYCCVFPIARLTLAGVTETAVTVLVVMAMLDVDVSPHPAMNSGSMSNVKKQKHHTPIPRQRRTAIIRPPTKRHKVLAH